jgi:hypothetical protein
VLSLYFPIMGCLENLLICLELPIFQVKGRLGATWFIKIFVQLPKWVDGII